MKVIIIGAGLIGRERIEALQYIRNHQNDIEISAVFDPNENTLQKIKEQYNVPVVNELKQALQTHPDWAFVCVPHDVAPHIVKSCFDMGANVLAEKPLGRNLNECQDVVNYKTCNLRLNVGFNYRFYEGIERAIRDYKLGIFGDLISVNMILAHGNSPDMKGSWKLDPVKDGGVLVDLGVHLLDLSSQISPSVKVEKSKLWKGFWNTGIIDEEAHILMSDDKGAIFNLQLSLNRWRSTFRLEINGTEGYGIVEGRGRSYGPQTYRTGERWGWNKYNKNQSDTEKLYACDTKKSFIDETMAVLDLRPQLIMPTMPCDDQEAVKVMQLLEDCLTAQG